MLNRIERIKHIGRFEDSTPDPSISLKRLTLVYAENGKGKSTITIICRSLRDNDPILIKEKLTLGSSERPYAKLMLESGEAIFDNEVWSKSDNNIEIFDTTFINENVFSGESVEHDHKKNLYRFVLGQEGAVLAQSVNDIDTKIRQKNIEISSNEVKVKAQIIGSIPIKDFLALTVSPYVNNDIKIKEKELESLKKARFIKLKSPFEKLSLPIIPVEEVKTLLGKTITDVAKDAEQKTRNHIKLCLDKNGHDWIQKGMDYFKDGKCPFCGQNLDSVELISAYQGYFNEGYLNLKGETNILFNRLSSLFSESALMLVQKLTSSNDALVEFWKDHIEANYPSTDFDEIQKIWKDMRELLLAELSKKSASPLDSLPLDESLATFSNYKVIEAKVFEYNKVIDIVNTLVAKKKLEVGGGNLVTMQEELNRLNNIKVRHSPEVAPICLGYQDSILKKSDLEREKAKSKEELEKFTKGVFDRYQIIINSYLKQISAGFEIVDTGTSFGGGTPSSRYRIKINNTSVDLGDGQTVGEACFRNILSQGDKNLLAFSFFLAKLQDDKDLKDKIVIFDDPISSLDNHRKTFTKEAIVKISNTAKQTIVMSHDPIFLRDIYELMQPNNNTSTLLINRKATSSELENWDILVETQEPYFKDYMTLIDFIDNGAPATEWRKIARSIRPLLEGYYKVKYHKEFSSKKMLGEFIVTVSAAITTERVAEQKANLSDITSINNYSKKYHHTNPNHANETISEQELKSFAELTMKLITQ